MKRGWIVPLLLLASACDQKEPTEESARKTARLNACVSAVQDWITAHAEHPHTYEALSFGEAQVLSRYRNNTADTAKESYVLKHTHRMRSIEGDTTTFSGYFVLDNDLNVVVVETHRSGSLGGGSVPDWKDWTDIFGRPMTAADTTAFQERSMRSMRHELERLIKTMDDGDAYVESSDNESGKALLDSIVKVLPK